MFKPQVPRCRTKNSQVKNPKHYEVFPDLEAIEVMARCATVAEWRGFCKLTVLKYRLRVGKKDDVIQELDKAEMYITLFEQHKHLCIPEQDYAPRKNDQ